AGGVVGAVLVRLVPVLLGVGGGGLVGRRAAPARAGYAADSATPAARRRPQPGRIDAAAGQAARLSRASGQTVPPGSQLPPASASLESDPFPPATGPVAPSAGQQGGRVFRGAPPSGAVGPQLGDTDAHVLEQSAQQW
ncbi:hypothetical protein ACWF7R_30420, partial [Nocardia rhamnosiphila]